VVCDLKQIFNEASNRNGKDSGGSLVKKIHHTLLRKIEMYSTVILHFSNVILHC
jgi:hypothetical protein